ncbi:MAG: hypothetical protein GFH27_549349n97 [Chloroflexi bacterium AL-W]|nr:hypothetical protein [Chloroflexi bacterium AL-N1]NOK69995.1 hypothetical protein [Chloroflexi bacterium AL-N10]NOK73707.1 hypothetical protein [Chloroflexi bacterium AL-N5]NOK85527.1 hypothetical protein [Chloroflexi bacterium AL-W]NOK91728.1 hypothetical protein [Chloroflexi bacterium AL-N15]
MHKFRATFNWILRISIVAYIIRWGIIQLRRVLLLPTRHSTVPITPFDVKPGIRRVVISDLHLGGGDRLDDFESDAELAAFFRYYAVMDEPVELILAGDIFEFLQVRVPNIGDYEWSEEASRRRLLIMLSAHPEPVAALREFVGHTDNQLTILIGNHDFELHYAAAKTAFRQACGLSDDDERIRFGITYEGGGVYLEHGNQFDPWNRFVHFEGISEPFEVVRGTRLMKDVINVLEDDSLEFAPLIDNVKPSSVLYWYVLSMSRLRRPEVRRFVIRALLLMFRSVALPLTYRKRPVLEVREELLGAPGETLQREMALQAVYEADEELRQAAATNYGGIEPEVQLRQRVKVPAALIQTITRRFGRNNEPPEQVLHRIEREAEIQMQREITEFKGAVLRSMARIAAGPRYGHNRLFVCGHTHGAQIVPLNDRQTYINTGTWTKIVRDIVTMQYDSRRFPFLDIHYPGGPAEPEGRLLLWQGGELPPTPWSETEEIEHATPETQASGMA